MNPSNSSWNSSSGSPWSKINSDIFGIYKAFSLYVFIVWFQHRKWSDVPSNNMNVIDLKEYHQAHVGTYIWSNIQQKRQVLSW